MVLEKKGLNSLSPGLVTSPVFTPKQVGLSRKVRFLFVGPILDSQ